MPKLSAEQTQNSDAIIRVEITAQMLNETDEKGDWKFTDDQLKEWLSKLRGDREVTMAKKIAKESGTATTSRPVKKALTTDDLL